MKLLALPLLLLGAGAGWFGLHERSAQATELPCAAQDCRVTVQCTGPDTCLVTCYDANDQVVCRREVTGDGPCERACPEKQGSKPCDEPCERGPEPCRSACQR